MCQSKQHRYVTLYNWSLIVQLELYLIGRYYTIRLKLCQLFQGLLDDFISVVDGENIILSSFYLLCVCKIVACSHYFSLAPLTEIYDYAVSDTTEEISSAEINETIDWIYSFFDEPGKNTLM